jgi:hypothetical protein
MAQQSGNARIINPPQPASSAAQSVRLGANTMKFLRNVTSMAAVLCTIVAASGLHAAIHGSALWICVELLLVPGAWISLRFAISTGSTAITMRMLAKFIENLEQGR